MAWGTQSCPKVDKILGPGNQFVTAAKMLLQNSEAMVAIDMPAGGARRRRRCRRCCWGAEDDERVFVLKLGYAWVLCVGWPGLQPRRAAAAAPSQQCAERASLQSLPAGPSEVMVIADAGADPVHIAIDLLSQVGGRGGAAALAGPACGGVA